MVETGGLERKVKMFGTGLRGKGCRGDPGNVGNHRLILGPRHTVV